MATANSIDIINLALTRANLRRISSLDDVDKKEARMAALEWDVARDAVMRARPWNFAMRRNEPLALLAVAAKEYAHAYAMPGDCVIFCRVTPKPGGGHAAHRMGNIDGQTVILTNEPGAEAEYVARVTNSVLFDASFVEALAWRLASAFSLGVKNDPQFSQTCLQFYANALADAGKLNAGENNEDEAWESDFILARYRRGVV